MGLCETFLNANTLNAANIQGYQILQKNRLNNQKGGLAFYIHTSLHFEDFDSLYEEILIEFLVIEVTIASEKVLLCMFYRPPSSSTKKYLDKFEEFAKMVSSKKIKIILMGDFNIDTSSVSHDSSTCAPSSTLATDFLTTSLAAGFVPSVWIPARVTNQNASIIDNQLVNFPVGSCDVILTDVSDHLFL